MKAIFRNHPNLLQILLIVFVIASFVRPLVSFFQLTHSNVGASIEPTNPAPTNVLPGMQAIAQLGWFGIAQDTQAASVAASITAQQFDLKGVSKSGQTKLVGAFIAEKGKPENYYHMRDALPGGAGTLEEIFDDHVTIRNGQSIAVLKFAPVDSSAAR